MEIIEGGTLSMKNFFANLFEKLGAAIKDGSKEIGKACEPVSAAMIARQTRLQAKHETREKAKVKRTETRWESLRQIVNRICTCIERIFGGNQETGDDPPQEKLVPPDYETIPIDEHTSVLVHKEYNSKQTQTNVNKKTAKPRKRPLHRKKRKN